MRFWQAERRHQKQENEAMLDGYQSAGRNVSMVNKLNKKETATPEKALIASIFSTRGYDE